MIVVKFLEDLEPSHQEHLKDYHHNTRRMTLIFLTKRKFETADSAEKEFSQDKFLSEIILKDTNTTSEVHLTKIVIVVNPELEMWRESLNSKVIREAFPQKREKLFKPFKI